MLYNPEWEAKVDPLTLENLIAWLEKQPAHVTYAYESARQCLLGQWIHATLGLTGSDLGTKSCSIGMSNRTLARIAYPPFEDGAFVFTFGAALARARAAVQS